MFAPLPTLANPLLATDVYKDGHRIQYKPGTTEVFSYLTSRSDRIVDTVVFFGLQYYLMQYLATPLKPWMAEEYIEQRRQILGKDHPEVSAKVRALCDLGYWPVRIKAVPEGTVMSPKNVVVSIRSTHPEFAWCVGVIESLLLKIWYSTNVASISYKYRRELQKRFKRTCPEAIVGVPFFVHDFGYRGDASEEGACISGAAHLASFIGSDTIPALGFVKKFYFHDGNGLMASVPASEHSVMCSYGQDGEIDAFRRMLELYPDSIVSIVSDTYNIWDVLTKFVNVLYDDIMARPEGAKVVFRPDSGDPIKIICGDPTASDGTPESKGCIQLLADTFGYTVNDSGFKVLNQKVGLIYGDGMYFERWVSIINEMERQGWAACNLVIGIGGILRYHTRDTLGFTLKATRIINNGEAMEIMKNPITDPGKKSHKGLVGLFRNDGGDLVTVDELSEAAEAGPVNLLEPVFENGEVIVTHTFAQIRARVEDALNRETA